VEREISQINNTAYGRERWMGCRLGGHACDGRRRGDTKEKGTVAAVLKAVTKRGRSKLSAYVVAGGAV